MCAQTQRSRKLSASQKMIFMFLRTHVKFALWFEWNFSLEFTSGLEFEFVIVINICDSNLLTHVLLKKKKSSLELFFTGMIIQITQKCHKFSPKIQLLLYWFLHCPQNSINPLWNAFLEFRNQWYCTGWVSHTVFDTNHSCTIIRIITSIVFSHHRFIE